MPDLALKASLGCGNPTALAELKAGETVLDLGSGGGIDVLLSARRVGPTGKAFGLDMTDEMLALAEENKRKSGLDNVEFLKGEIEHIPLPDNSVDVIISNCVINLSGDKDQVLREAFRVLKPGGRFAVSDVVVRGAVPDVIRKNMELWIGCVAGALAEHQYVAKLVKAGFRDIGIEETREYSVEDARTFLASEGLDADRLAKQVDGTFVSAFIRASKPAAARAATPAAATEMERVVFACVHNAGRSQMAAAFLSALADPSRVEAVSAGTQPGDHVHPVVVDVMREVGIDLGGNRPQRLTEDLARDASLLVTMGCGEECPYVPGLQTDDWPLPDPKDRPLAEVRAIRDEIRARVAALVEARGWRRVSVNGHSRFWTRRWSTRTAVS